jgi:hypothetical protein
MISIKVLEIIVNLTKEAIIRQTMKMICDRVECKGGGRKDFKNYAKKSSRIILFPDGVQRIMTLPKNDWRIIDQAFPEGLHPTSSTLAFVLRHADKRPRAMALSREDAIQYVFARGVSHLARKEALGITAPANVSGIPNPA